MNRKYLPLTDVQRAYLYGRNQGLFLGGISTHYYIEYRTKLDLNKIERALNCVIAEQPSLRSYITSDSRQCFMNSAPLYVIREEDVSKLTPEEQEKKVIEKRTELSARMFPLDKWPMFEFQAFKLSEEEHMLFIDGDMMVMDGMSTEILLEGLYRYYDSTNDVDVIPFEVLEKHTRYIEEQREKNLEQDEKFWKEIIPQLPSGPQFPQIQDVRNMFFESCEQNISREEWDNVKSRMSKKHVLPSVYVMAAYAKTLARWCSQSKITLNITVSNRKGSEKGLQRAIGDFTEVMLVDFDLEKTQDCMEIALQTQKKISSYKKHRTFDSSAVIREYSKLNNIQDRFPFPVVCTSMMFDKAGSKWDWLGERTFQVSQTPQVVLDNQVSLKDGSLYIHWDYVRECFSKTSIRKMQKEYIANLLGREDEVQNAYDKTAEAYNQTACEIEKTDLVKLFKKAAAHFSGSTAVADENGTIDYGTLDVLSDKIAVYTVETYGVHQPIILRMSRHINAIAAMLGILKSGGYYIPVAEDIPKQRLNFIKEQSGSSVIYDDETVAEILAQPDRGQPVDYAGADEIAYVIYTSGSTGSPKGVVIKHDAVCNTVQDINQRFKVTKKDRFIGISFFGFDLSVYDIFGSLTCGGTLYLASSAHDVFGIRERVIHDEITVWNTVPSIMELFINNIPDDYVNNYMRLVMLSGDWISLGLPEKIHRHFPQAAVYSLGGATEASIWSIYYPVDQVRPEWNSIPYGYPLANQSIWILDELGRICPEGVVGEICIGGRGVAFGYLNDPERTNKQFIEHPKLGNIYLTGDLGFLTEEGFAVIKGRKDFQVKLNGYRIELGEIENCLLKCTNVREAIADVKEAYGQKMLCAYVTAKKSGCIEKKDIGGLKNKIREMPPKIPAIGDNRYEEVQEILDEYSLRIMFCLLYDLADGRPFSVDELVASGKINERYRKIVIQWADSLAENNYLTDKEGVYSFRVKDFPNVDTSRITDVESWNTALEFLAECSEKLQSVISGGMNPMALLFKDGKRDVAENLYGSNPVAAYYNAFVSEFAKAFAEESRKKIRILEVGAGVGATTEPVLRSLSGYDISYEFTDLSEFFNDIARERFGDESKLRYGILDIEANPYSQGYHAGQFDMIIAANVIHDVKSIKESLTNLRTLLSSEGVLLLLEVTRSRQFHKISMGLMNGYTAYKDAVRIKQNSPLLDSEGWKRELTDAGFTDVLELTSGELFNGGQSVLVASSGKNMLYPDAEEMRNTLNETVAAYMMPENIIVMDELPYTSNGKIDRKNLPVCAVDDMEIIEEYIAPEGEMEILVSDILCEVAKAERVSVTANFVHLGIDSLKGITFITKLQEKGIKISLSELYEHSSIRDLCAYAEECKKSEESLEFGEI